MNSSHSRSATMPDMVLTHPIRQPAFSISGFSKDQIPELTVPGNRIYAYDYFDLYWIKTGSCVITVNQNEYELSENNIYCIAPGNRRQLQESTAVSGIHISFTPEFMYSREGSTEPTWFDNSEQLHGISSYPLTTDMQKELDFIASKIMREYQHHFNRKTELIRGLLQVFFIYFLRDNSPQQYVVHQTREQELVEKFLRLLKKKFLSYRMVSEYADDLCVTPNYLNRTIKRATGFTASHHIQQRIILEAKKQAMISTISMKEIAYSLGFDNLAHFSKFFKINCGMNFTAYKRSQFLLQTT